MFSGAKLRSQRRLSLPPEVQSLKSQNSIELSLYAPANTRSHDFVRLRLTSIGRTGKELLGLGVPIIQLAHYDSITIAGRVFELFPVENGDASAGIGDQSGFLQDAGGDGHAGAARA